MLRAIDRAGWKDKSFADWGVVGCPRFVGRLVIGNTTWRFATDAKYSINPHIIPNYSLHSLSGTASIGLTMHGLNFGVGGGPRNAAEGLLTALSVMVDSRVPGLWLLLSACDPEPRPDEQGNAVNEFFVHAVALALMPSSGGAGSLCLMQKHEANSEPNSIASLAEFIASPSGRWTCAVDGLGELELSLS
jgi:hypothetical protein